VYDLQQRLRKYALKGRWKYIDNFHLTLKFLDEISISQRQQIDELMNRICAGQAQFKLEAAELGIFPGKDSVRVLWLGLSGDIKHLRLFAGKIDSSLTEIGFQPEKRPYTPHITIGQDIIFECPFEQIHESVGRINIGPVNVTQAALFKSEQIENKRIYTKISEYDLKQR